MTTESNLVLRVRGTRPVEPKNDLREAHDFSRTTRGGGEHAEPREIPSFQVDRADLSGNDYRDLHRNPEVRAIDAPKRRPVRTSARHPDGPGNGGKDPGEPGPERLTRRPSPAPSVNRGRGAWTR